MHSYTTTTTTDGLEVEDSRAMLRVASKFRAQLARVRNAQAQAAAVEASPGESEGRPTASTVAPGSSRSTTELNGAPASPRGSVGAKILDHDHVVCLGDTNSRLHWPGHLGGMPLQQARQKVQQRRFGELLALDQLALMRRDRMAFHDFEEHPIYFLPSYKWQPETDAYDMRSQKHEAPHHPPKRGQSAQAQETALPEDHAVSKAGLSALRFRKLQPREDEVLAALAEQRAAPAPAPAAGGVPKEVWMGYHRLFARDYFERWGHWSTGGPQKLPGAAGAPSPAPAWTDRILFRSKTSPGIMVAQYNMHHNLKQSDHRVIFASLRCSCDEQIAGRRRQRPTAFGEATTLAVEPKEISFKGAKPDVAMQHTVQLSMACASGLLRQRYEVFFETPGGFAWPLAGWNATWWGYWVVCITVEDSVLAIRDVDEKGEETDFERRPVDTRSVEIAGYFKYKDDDDNQWASVTAAREKKNR
ncbi:unnamed protein product [Durusdinium trenchii]|uniref:Inositol polyphosphate-related phosphatase domain-containing protein n=1 Tax=Durusdinium trenchii TaxID=1381693 RepID=A0ABP0SNC2_9DINO